MQPSVLVCGNARLRGGSRSFVSRFPVVGTCSFDSAQCGSSSPVVGTTSVRLILPAADAAFTGPFLYSRLLSRVSACPCQFQALCTRKARSRCVMGASSDPILSVFTLHAVDLVNPISSMLSQRWTDPSSSTSMHTRTHSRR